MKINTICFVLFLFLLVGVVSASEDTNETLQTIEQPDVVKISVNSSDGFLEKSLASDPLLQSTQKSTSSASKSKVTLKASDVKMYYGDGSKFKITLKDNKKNAIKSAKVKISINGKTYTKETNSKGEACIGLGFDSGKYKVTTTYEGSSKYAKKSISNTVNIKSTISASDFTKYYKNNKAYTATFYNTDGKILKKTKIKYQLDNKVSSAKTNSKGVLSIKITSKPGNHILFLLNSKTGEHITKNVKIKSTIEHHSYGMTYDALVTYKIKVLDSDGKVAKNKKIVFKVDKKEYKVFSDVNGIATLSQKFPVGSHTIISKYDGQEIGYQFEVYQLNPTQDNNQNTKESQISVKKTNFTHSILIPDYVNVTADYVFQNSEYTLKTGYNGIIKMPKNDIFSVVIGDNEYFFSKNSVDGQNINLLDGSCYLIPFDGSPISHKYNKNSLAGEGIVIYNEGGNNIVEYRGLSETNFDLFAVYLSHYLFGETITYMQNNETKAQVTFFTNSYDEQGVKHNLNKMNPIFVYDVNSKNYVIANNGIFLKYAQNDYPLHFNFYGETIPEQLSNEKIITKLAINGVEEFEKPEIISYGQYSDNGITPGFEVLQSFAIINDKVTQSVVEDWVGKNTTYVPKYCIQNVYEMFMIGLETAWIADMFADVYANNLSVTWQRNSPAVIMGGVNLDDIYMHILNADMGMDVKGDSSENEILFRLYNSINLPNLEEYALSQISDSNSTNKTNSLDLILKSVSNNNFSMVQMGEMFYILSDDGSNSTVIINSTSGIAEVIMYGDNFVYKGATVDTDCDWCNIQQSVHRVLGGIGYLIKNKVKSDMSLFNFVKNKINPLCVIGYSVFSTGIGLVAGIGEGTTLLGLAGFASIVGTMVGCQSIAVQVRERLFDKKDTYKLYDLCPLTRNGPIQYKKCFNIPQSDGSIHYVEVGISSDNKLDRNNAVYISPSGTRKLTKEETYKYFDEETWVVWSVPKKYQNYPIPI